MGTWIGAFVEQKGRSDLREVLATCNITLEGSPEGDWIHVMAEVSLASLKTPPFGEALSRELGGRVIGFLLQTTASVEEIVCWENGEQVRRLSYFGDEGGWLHHEGEPQDWEPTYFFEAERGTAQGQPWPMNLDEELSDEDIARYEEAKAAGDAEPILDLIQVGSGWGLYRLAEHLGVRADAPDAIYRPPENQTFRWKVYAVLAGIALVLLAAFLLGRA
jgi:hypothetical protein